MEQATVKEHKILSIVLSFKMNINSKSRAMDKNNNIMVWYGKTLEGERNYFEKKCVG